MMTMGSLDGQRRKLGANTMERLLASILVTLTTSGLTKIWRNLIRKVRTSWWSFGSFWTREYASSASSPTRIASAYRLSSEKAKSLNSVFGEFFIFYCMPCHQLLFNLAMISSQGTSTIGYIRTWGWAWHYIHYVPQTWYEGDVELPEPLLEKGSGHVCVTAGAWLPLVIATLDTRHLVIVSRDPEDALGPQAVHGWKRKNDWVSSMKDQIDFANVFYTIWELKVDLFKASLDIL